MRAILIDRETLSRAGTPFTLEGEQTHHLLNVVRLKKSERLLALDGQGHSAAGIVVEVGKRSITLALETPTNHSPPRPWDLAVGIIKKDSMDEVLRLATELGVRRIIPLRTEFSQRDWTFGERQKRILESALLQSNNFWLPEVVPPLAWEELPTLLKQYRQIFLFGPQVSPAGDPGQVTGQPLLAIIGPEGGLSAPEEAWPAEWPEAKTLKLQTPILRTPTAVAVAWGHLLGRLTP